MAGVGSIAREGRAGQSEANCWRVRGMAVAQNMQGSGIGGLVLEALVAYAAQQGDPGEVWCSGRVAAQTFYERHGFVASGTIFDHPFTGPHLVFHRPLSRRTTMSIPGLHHAQITIPRGAEEQGRQFYCQLLGLPEIEKPASLQGRGGFWLQVGDRQVHVGTEDGVERQATKAHLAYQVSDAEEWRQHLQVHGIQILDGVSIPGYTRFEFRDPFGNRIEFIQPDPI